MALRLAENVSWQLRATFVTDLFNEQAMKEGRLPSKIPLHMSSTSCPLRLSQRCTSERLRFKTRDKYASIYFFIKVSHISSSELCVKLQTLNPGI